MASRSNRPSSTSAVLLRLCLRLLLVGLLLLTAGVALALFFAPQLAQWAINRQLDAHGFNNVSVPVAAVSHGTVHTAPFRLQDDHGDLQVGFMRIAFARSGLALVPDAVALHHPELRLRRVDGQWRIDGVDHVKAYFSAQASGRASWSMPFRVLQIQSGRCSLHDLGGRVIEFDLTLTRETDYRIAVDGAAVLDGDRLAVTGHWDVLASTWDLHLHADAAHVERHWPMIVKMLPQLGDLALSGRLAFSGDGQIQRGRVSDFSAVIDDAVVAIQHQKGQLKIEALSAAVSASDAPWGFDFQCQGQLQQGRVADGLTVRASTFSLLGEGKRFVLSANNGHLQHPAFAADFSLNANVVHDDAIANCSVDATVQLGESFGCGLTGLPAELKVTGTPQRLSISTPVLRCLELEKAELADVEAELDWVPERPRLRLHGQLSVSPRELFPGGPFDADGDQLAIDVDVLGEREAGGWVQTWTVAADPQPVTALHEGARLFGRVGCLGKLTRRRSQLDGRLDLKVADGLIGVDGAKVALSSSSSTWHLNGRLNDTSGVVESFSVEGRFAASGNAKKHERFDMAEIDLELPVRVQASRADSVKGWRQSSALTYEWDGALTVTGGQVRADALNCVGWQLHQPFVVAVGEVFTPAKAEGYLHLEEPKFQGVAFKKAMARTELTSNGLQLSGRWSVDDDPEAPLMVLTAGTAQWPGRLRLSMDVTLPTGQADRMQAWLKEQPETVPKSPAALVELFRSTLNVE